MKSKMHVDWTWIRSHLPREFADRDIGFFGGYYLDGRNVMLEGERGESDTLEYAARDDEDLRLWQFDHVCELLSYALELEHRTENAKKWRYVRVRAENGKWLYAERRSYIYNAIEDTRLAAFERYLRLIHPVYSPEHFEERVQAHVRLLNRWYRTPHWDFDRNALCFVEVSDAKEYGGDADDTEEPRTGSVIQML